MARSIKHAVCGVGLLFLTVATTGCGQRGPAWELVPVEGTVTRNGRPLAGIEVCFRADAGTTGPRAQGTTDELGHYRLHTDFGGDGTVVGDHRVCIADGRAMRETPMDKRRVPPEYNTFNDTPLRAQVSRAPLVFNIQVP